MLLFAEAILQQLLLGIGRVSLQPPGDAAEGTEGAEAGAAPPRAEDGGGDRHD